MCYFKISTSKNSQLQAYNQHNYVKISVKKTYINKFTSTTKSFISYIIKSYSKIYAATIQPITTAIQLIT